MFDDVLSELECGDYVTVHTNNKELKNKIKELEANKTGGNAGVGKFTFICENIKVDREDKYQFYVRFIDNKCNNKIEEYDSYVHTNDYETAVLDLINSMYTNGYVKLCASDVRYILDNKSFNHYKYIINEPVTPKLINNILDNISTNNKKCILICYGNDEVAKMEYNITCEVLKTRINEPWLLSYITNDNKSYDRHLSLYLEK